jgi:hypothetical protein
VKTDKVIEGVHRDILLRMSAFLLLKDSKASFNIEGGQPTHTRALRWGKAMGQAGTNPLSVDELLRLQQIVIDNARFIHMGFRTEGGFIGSHDRNTGEPIPDHISSRWQDIETLVKGMIEAERQLETKLFHPVLTAAMLNRINDYRMVLESYSHSVMDFIVWRKTPGNNVEVLNETIDYYRYFDATMQAEFLFECVDYTINKIIPDEINYLQRYDKMKTWLDNHFQMPDTTVSLIIQFLYQNNGKLSKRAKEKEFAQLTENEVIKIEEHYQDYFS